MYIINSLSQEELQLVLLDLFEGDQIKWWEKKSEEHWGSDSILK